MAQTPWTGLLAGSSSPLLASGDVVAFVDVSDTTQSAQGSLVKTTVVAFFAALPSPVNITSASASAFAVGLAGATNSAFLVDASTASQVAGLKVTGAVTGGTVAVVVTDSGSDANLTVNAKGAGTIGIGSVSTGRVTITPVTTITGALTLGSTLTGGATSDIAINTNKFTVAAGSGNTLIAGTLTTTGALTQTGLATFNGGATVASGQTLTVSGATITGLTAASVATGTFPGVYTVTGAVTLSAALTYGGVTLTNAVTGTGKMVLSAGPTFTGTLSAAAGAFSGAVDMGALTATTGTFSSFVTGSWLTVSVGQPGSIGASKGVVDFASGAARWWSSGANGATNGTFLLRSQRSDGTNQLDVLTSDVSANVTFIGTVIGPASAAGASSVRLPHGIAPSSPVNGDMWTTTSGLFVRINGSTVGPLT